MTKRQREKLEAAARRGARLLDRLSPRWWEKLDIPELDLASRSHCVLGQLFGDYSNGLTKLSRLLPVGKWNYADRWKYGFSTIEPGPEQWSLLTEAWVVEIRKRRGEL